MGKGEGEGRGELGPVPLKGQYVKQVFAQLQLPSPEGIEPGTGQFPNPPGCQVSNAHPANIYVF